MICRLLILLYLTCIPLGISADTDPRHQQNSHATNPSDTGADTENPSKDPSQGTQPPNGENNSEKEKEKPKSPKEILAALKKEDPDTWKPTLTGKERHEYIRELVNAMGGELSDAEREDLVSQLFESLGGWEPNDLEVFFGSVKNLPADQKKQLEEAVFSVTSRNPNHLYLLPKDMQKNGLNRAIEAARNDPALVRSLAAAAAGLNFPFQRSDLEKWVLQDKVSHPELIKQLVKNVPDASERLLRAVSNEKDPATRGKFLEDIRRVFQEGHVEWGSQDLSLIGDLVTNKNLPEGDRKAAYNLLESHPLTARNLLSTLLKSNDPSELLSAAAILGGPRNKPELADTKTQGIFLDKVIALTGTEFLDPISKNFNEYHPTLQETNPENLKKFIAFSMGGSTPFHGSLLRESLRSLSQSASANELRPFVEEGFKKHPLDTTSFLDGLPAEKAKAFSSLAPKVMEELLGALNPATSTTRGMYLPKGQYFLENFPDLIKQNAGKLEEASYFRGVAFQLLGATGDSKYLGKFLENMSNPDPLTSSGAINGLGKLLKSHPEITNSEIWSEISQRLSSILSAVDENDTQRLQIRQFLPEGLVRKLDREILDAAVQKQDPGRFAATLEKTQKAAIELFSAGEQAGLLAPGEQALALQYLVESGYPEAPTMTQKFLETTNTKGSIHNVNAVLGLLRATKEAGMKLPEGLAERVQAQVESDAGRMVNAGPLAASIRNGPNRIDSNLISYAAAAFLTAAPDDLTPTQKQVLERIRQMSDQVPAGEPLRLPYGIPQGGGSPRVPSEDIASTSGRDLTARLALYQQAASENKPDAALALLRASQTFLDHFSQTHEIPLTSGRTHDRTPGSHQMALYYGTANDVSLSTALRLLSTDETLTSSQRSEVFNLSTEARNRILMLTEKDGTVRKRQQESYANENLVNQVLIGLSLKDLPLSPQERLRRSAQSPPLK